ncbi:MAG: extracellular solute-binding protein [Spirochaetales bacterium]|nr:extracellular solute-binding protein [Spirochaetales bacterium]
MKKIAVVMLMLLLVFGVVFAQGGKEAAPAAEEKPAEAAAPGEPIEVVYWHTWGSNNLAYLQDIADKFNASQSVYHITLEYVGNMNALYSKLQVTDQADRPALINSTTETLGSFIYTDYVVPLAEFVADNAPADQPILDAIYPNMVAAWGDKDGKLYGYPMGNSMTGCLFNMNVMNEVGIDPYSMKSVEDFQKIIYTLGESGKLPGSKVIGFEHTIRFFNYSLAIEGLFVEDQENGRLGVPQVSYYNTGEVGEIGKKFFKIWKEINDSGYAYTMGTSWGNELLPAFAQQDIVMLTGTIGGYGRVERAWNEVHTDPINATFVPWVAVTADGRSTGQPASGNGFYIVNNGNLAQMKGAWEFIKFFGTGDNMAGWCALTGYLPFTDEVLNTKTYQDYKNARPNLGLDYLMEVQKNDDGKTYHPISAVYTETSAIGVNKLNAYLNGGDLDQLFVEYENEMNDALYMWYLTNT